jgi:hypothetical protein
MQGKPGITKLQIHFFDFFQPLPNGFANSCIFTYSNVMKAATKTYFSEIDRTFTTRGLKIRMESSRRMTTQ